MLVQTGVVTSVPDPPDPDPRPCGPTPRARRLRSVAVVVGATVLAAACSSDDPSSTVDPAAAEPSPSSDDSPEDAFTPAQTGVSAEVAASDATTDAGSSSVADGDGGLPDDAVVESLDPVPETGVAGLESEDEFCRAWSLYAASAAGALPLVWALRDASEAARLEVAASGAVIDAVATMAETLPPEIESNRREFVVEVPGPFLRRAERAQAFLAEAGADDDTVDVLGDAWVAALAESGADDETIDVDVPDGVDATLTAAAERFAAEIPSIERDPTLDTTEFDIGPSLSYIADTCPDQGTLAGDAVGD